MCRKYHNCTNVISIKIEGKNPPTIDKSTFDNKVRRSLHILEGSKEAYLNAQYWNEFQNVVEMLE